MADESGDHRYPKRRRRQTSRGTGSMNGRLLVTYQQTRPKRKNIVNTRFLIFFFFFFSFLGRIQQQQPSLSSSSSFSLASRRRWSDGWKKKTKMIRPPFFLLPSPWDGSQSICVVVDVRILRRLLT
jgi:hypothetical protein